MARTTAAVLIVLTSLTSANAARAQIIDSGNRRSFGQTQAWVSLGIGWLSQRGLCDPGTDACWNFGGAPQWRASLEFPTGRGVTFGGAATTARVPLTYAGNASSPCPSGCDADANISQFFAQLHLGGGSSLHQALDISAGAAVFSNFRSASGTRLGGKAVTNVSFAVAYGIAYPVTPSFHLTLQQDLGLIIGRRMSGVPDNNAEQSVLRISARVGLGG